MSLYEMDSYLDSEQSDYDEENIKIFTTNYAVCIHEFYELFGNPFESFKESDNMSLKQKLLELNFKNLFRSKCSRCGITAWNGHPLVLRLYHIDDDETNTSIENLRLVCGNCYSQLYQEDETDET